MLDGFRKHHDLSKKARRGEDWRYKAGGGSAATEVDWAAECTGACVADPLRMKSLVAGLWRMKYFNS